MTDIHCFIRIFLVRNKKSDDGVASVNNMKHSEATCQQIFLSTCINVLGVFNHTFLWGVSLCSVYSRANGNMPITDHIMCSNTWPFTVEIMYGVEGQSKENFTLWLCVRVLVYNIVTVVHC